jgi:hypothetical protein
MPVREHITVEELLEVVKPETFGILNHPIDVWIIKDIIGRNKLDSLLNFNPPSPDPIEELRKHWMEPKVNDHFYVLGTYPYEVHRIERINDRIGGEIYFEFGYRDDNGELQFIDGSDERILPIFSVGQMIDIINFTARTQIQNFPKQMIYMDSHTNSFHINEDEIIEVETVDKYGRALKDYELRFEKFMLMLWKATKFALHESY